MSRTIGARDKRRRRTRKDLGKKHKTYRGKKPKGIRRIRFEKREGQKNYIKLRPFEKRKMSKQGYLNWNKRFRKYVHPFVYPPGAVILTPVSDLSNKEDIENWALEAIGYEGYFIIMGMSFTFRNKYKRKWIPMFDVVIKDSPYGLVANMVRNRRLFRYWFWQKK